MSVPIYVLGLGLPGQRALPFSHPVLNRADVLIGGKAQLALFASHPAEKLPVGADTKALYARMADLRAKGKALVALCSGDPLFFGLGARLAERFGSSSIRVLPGISSLQAAAALVGLAWEDVRPVSLHGRKNMLPLAHALLNAAPVFLLCDPGLSLRSLAIWMGERGCGHYRLHVLEDLYATPEGEIRAETALQLSMDQALRCDGHDSAPASVQRVILLVPEQPFTAKIPFGLAEADLAKEQGLVTKLPIRAAGLAALGVEAGHIVWDLGAGSGAVSLEAARLAPCGRIFAVERHRDRVALIRENRRRFRVPHLEIVQDAFPACLDHVWDNAADFGELHQAVYQGPLPRPHRIFVGGGLSGARGAAEALLGRAWEALLPGGRLLAHCVLLSSLELSRTLLEKLGGKVSVTSVQAGVSEPLAGDLRFKALNPVFLVLAVK